MARFFLPAAVIDGYNSLTQQHARVAAERDAEALAAAMQVLREQHAVELREKDNERELAIRAAIGYRDHEFAQAEALLREQHAVALARLAQRKDQDLEDFAHRHELQLAELATALQQKDNERELAIRAVVGGKDCEYAQAEPLLREQHAAALARLAQQKDEELEIALSALEEQKSNEYTAALAAVSEQKDAERLAASNAIGNQNDQGGVRFQHWMDLNALEFVEDAVWAADFPFGYIVFDKRTDCGKRYLKMKCPTDRSAASVYVASVAQNRFEVTFEIVQATGSKAEFGKVFDFKRAGHYFEFKEDETLWEEDVVTLVFQPYPFVKRVFCLSGNVQSNLAVPRSSSAVPSSVDHQSCPHLSDRSWDVVSGSNVNSQAASDDSSNKVSSSQLSCGSVKCYFPNTIFKNSDGNFSLALNLKQDEELLQSFAGSETKARVAHVRHHTKRHVPLVELITGQGGIKLSANHRVEVADAAGVSVRLAGDLQEGVDKVFVGRRERLLTKVRHFTDKIALVEIGFDPDVPVEAALAPAWGVQTRGIEREGGPCVLQLLPQVIEDELLRAMPLAYDD